jgi:BirA family biotin operon repressor/biotin-[acetyl-CoA-carboxylase] ligase
MSMLHESDDKLLPKIIQERLPGSIFTRHIYYFPSIGSTNAYAKELAKKGGAEGSLVIAEKQTEGKGRMGRKWYSPSHVNLYFSVIFRPPFSIDRVFSLNMLIALALVDAIYNITGLKTLIKWPNDVYFTGKKMAGILTEFSANKKRAEYVIVGTGLNVNWDIKDKPELQYLATSLIKEIGHIVSRVDLLVKILELLERYYRLLLRDQDSFIYKRWNELSMVIGKEVLIGSSNERKKARVKGIDKNGALVIKDENGKESSIICGDVKVLFPPLPGN